MSERISALMDSEVDETELDRDLVRLRANGDLRRTWDIYHLIGDTLRGHVAPAQAAEVWQRLASEPAVLAPRRRETSGKIAQFGLQAAAVAAALAAVAVVAWQALPGLKPEPQQLATNAPVSKPPIAHAAPVTPAAVDVGGYLLAHQGFSPAGAMQGVAPYVRTVTDDRGGRGK